jgi:L-aspartate oxidase
VFGVRLAEQVAQELINCDRNDAFPLEQLEFTEANTSPEIQTRIATIRQELSELTWRSAGICRNADDLQEAIAQIENFQQEIINLRSQTRTWVETRNLIDFAYLLVKSALFRTESRGAHFRIDYPNTETAWLMHTVVHRQNISRQ